jgi:hypothetical protein
MKNCHICNRVNEFEVKDAHFSGGTIRVCEHCEEHMKDPSRCGLCGTMRIEWNKSCDIYFEQPETEDASVCGECGDTLLVEGDH